MLPTFRAVPASAADAPCTGRDLCGLASPRSGDEPFECDGDDGGCGVDGVEFPDTRPGDSAHADVVLPFMLPFMLWFISRLAADWCGTTFARRTVFTGAIATAGSSDASDVRFRSPSENRRNLLFMSCHTRAGTVVPRTARTPATEPAEDTLSVSDMFSTGAARESTVATESCESRRA